MIKYILRALLTNKINVPLNSLLLESSSPLRVSTPSTAQVMSTSSLNQLYPDSPAPPINK